MALLSSLSGGPKLMNPDGLEAGVFDYYLYSVLVFDRKYDGLYSY